MDERFGERALAEKLLRRLRQDEVHGLLGREHCRLRTGLRGGVRGDAAPNSSHSERFRCAASDAVAAASSSEPAVKRTRISSRPDPAARASAIASRSGSLASSPTRTRMERRLPLAGCSSASRGPVAARSSSRRNGDGLDPELGVERLARRAVDVERLRLPAGSVQGPHERTHETLVERMRMDERLELRNELCVAAEREVCIDAQLQRREARSFETLGFRLRENVVRQLGEGLPAPESQRLAEQPARTRGVFRAFRLAHQALEAEQVELAGVDPNEVARVLGDDRRAVPEHLPQLGDVELERIRRSRWRVIRPQRVDQAVDGDGAVGRQQEQGEQRSLLDAAQRQDAACVHDFERPQNPKLHRLPSATNYEPAPGLRKGSVAPQRRA